MNKIEWTKVTWYSQIIAIALFVGIFSLGYLLGMQAVPPSVASVVTPIPHGARAASNAVVADVTYTCAAGKTVRAIYHAHDAMLALSDGRAMTLPQVISADGGRYANADESIVFWSKGTGAFMTEGSTTTYASCQTKTRPD